MVPEKRMIDANKIPYHKSGFPKGDGFDSGLDWAFREDIEKLPTVDAVEVVRCEVCQSHELCEVRGKVWCGKLHRYMKEGGFCSEGVQGNV